MAAQSYGHRRRRALITVMSGTVMSGIDFGQSVLDLFPISYWNSQETSGSVAEAYNPALALGRELVVNSALTNWSGVFPNETPIGWTKNGNDATNYLTENPAGQMQYVSDGVNLRARPTPLAIGKTYTYTYVVSAVASGTTRLWDGVSVIKDTTIPGTFTGTFTATGTIYEIKRVSGVTNFTTDSLSTKQTDILASSAYPTPGDNPLDGSDTGTAVGTATGTNLGYARTFDGATSFIDIYSVELNSKFNPDAGTIIMYANSDTWAASIDYLLRLGVDANNGILAYRTATDLILSYDAGGTAESVTIASGSPTGYFQVALTWDTTGGGAVKAYYNGAQSGSTQTIAGTFVGNLASTLCCIGASATTPTNVWDGDITQVQLYDKVLTASEILAQYRGAGI